MLEASCFCWWVNRGFCKLYPVCPAGVSPDQNLLLESVQPRLKGLKDSTNFSSGQYRFLLPNLGAEPLPFLAVFANSPRNLMSRDTEKIMKYLDTASQFFFVLLVDLKTGTITDPGITGQARWASIAANIGGLLLICGGEYYGIRDCFHMDKAEGKYSIFTFIMFSKSESIYGMLLVLLFLQEICLSGNGLKKKKPSDISGQREIFFNSS